MGIGDQFTKVKDNWLILLLVLVVVVLLSGASNLGSFAGKMSMSESSRGYYPDQDYSGAIESYSPGYTKSSDFAPEVEVRKLTKTSYLTSEVARGEFQQARDRLGSIITSSGAYLLNEQVNRNGNAKHPYRVGSYQLKIDATKYDAVMSQLKELGEISSFQESQTDITGSYTNLEIELEAESARLTRYQTMLEEASIVSDQITLSDKIFDQERRIKYLKDSLGRMDQRVDYSTVYLTINEKQSGYANLALVKLSQLVSSLVESFNALLYIVFVLIPWALALGLIVLAVRFIRSRS